MFQPNSFSPVSFSSSSFAGLIARLRSLISRMQYIRIQTDATVIVVPDNTTTLRIKP